MATDDRTSLHVEDLGANVSEVIVYDAFKGVGPLTRVRVNRKEGTKGTADVSFRRSADAARALEAGGGQYPTLGKSAKLKWCEDDDGEKGPEVTPGLGLVNVGKGVTEEQLRERFGEYGEVVACRVRRDDAGNPQGTAVIQYKTVEAVHAAADSQNGELVASLPLTVRRLVGRSSRADRVEESNTTCHVRGLKATVGHDALVGHFTQYGTVQRAVVKFDDRARAYAFIIFQDPESCRKAIQGADGQPAPTLVAGVTDVLRVTRAKRSSEKSSELRKKHGTPPPQTTTTNPPTSGEADLEGETNLYIKHLHDTVTEDMLREAFLKYGDITSVKIMMDDRTPPQSRGFGFVCFTDKDTAMKAMAEMHGYMLAGKPLYVNLAQRKEVRRATLEMQYAARVGRQMMGLGSVQGRGGQPVPQTQKRAVPHQQHQHHQHQHQHYHHQQQQQQQQLQQQALVFAQQLQAAGVVPQAVMATR